MKRLFLMALLTSAASAAPATFLKVYSNGVELLQWTELNGQLTGTWQIVYRQGTPPTLQSENEVFTGVRNGSSVSLTFREAVFGITDTRTWTGVLSRSTFQLNRPQSGGGVDATTLNASTVKQYNAAVGALKAQVQAEVQAFQARQKAQAAQQAQVDEQNRLIRDADQRARDRLEATSSVLEDFKGIERDLNSAVGGFTGDLEALRSDQQKLLQDAAHAKDCFDVKTVQGYDLHTLTGYDLGTLTGYDAKVFESALAAQNQAMTRATAVDSDLRTAAQDFYQMGSRLPLATVNFSVDAGQFDAAFKALSTGVARAQQVRAAAVTSRDRVMTVAQGLIKDAQQVAGGLTCAK